MLTKEFSTRDEYFAYDALNYSYIKSFTKDPEAKRESSLSGSGITYGTALDCLLFDGKEEFDKQFICIAENKPTASLLTLYESVIEDVKNGIVIDVDIDYLCKKVEELGLWTTIKNKEKIQQKFTSEFLFYLTHSINNLDKVILDKDTYDNICIAANSIYTERTTSKFFEDYEVLTQLAFAFKDENTTYDLECKVMLDMVCIDKKNKRIIPIDLKSMSDPANQFKANVIKYSYFLQADLYTKGLYIWAKEKGYKGYIIENFQYIVVSSLNPYRPYVYKLPDIKDFIDELNRTSPFKTKTIQEILKDYKTNLKLGNFEYPAELLTNGFIQL